MHPLENNLINALENQRIAVVIPCFRVKRHILNVIKTIEHEVEKIYIIDDCCPEKSGQFVIENCSDARVKVLFNETNLGVGGAVIHGYRAAMDDDMHIAIKFDGDGQMDPQNIRRVIKPILEYRADYTKGNRFYDLESLKDMPYIRLLGNAALSFLNKLVTGYWEVMDPTNGFTAISVKVLRALPLHKIASRYFFESDMLFRLSTIRAVVLDVPMKARYGDEESNLRIFNVLTSFPQKYFIRFLKRIIYNYYLRDFNLGSLFLLVGFCLTSFGSIFGTYSWYHALQLGGNYATPTGIIMIAVLSIVIGFQCLLFFFQQDISVKQTVPLSKSLD